MIIKKPADHHEKPVIDLTGPDGNAFVVMAYAKNYAKQLEWTKQEIDDMLNEMKQTDYKHLIQVFEKYFGDYVTLLTNDDNLLT